jgi:hypothetical protein
MTMTQVMQRYNALSQIEKGFDGKPFDIPWEQLMLATIMMNALKPHDEGFRGSRASRLKAMCGDEVQRDAFGGIVPKDPVKELRFKTEEEEMLHSIVSVRPFPKEKLDLAPSKNKVPPTLLSGLEGLVKMDAKVFEMEDEEVEATFGRMNFTGPGADAHERRKESDGRPYVHAAE